MVSEHTKIILKNDISILNSPDPIKSMNNFLFTSQKLQESFNAADVSIDMLSDGNVVSNFSKGSRRSRVERAVTKEKMDIIITDPSTNL